ncbi:MAG: ankyrin repeat domain-containing protein [Leptospiraceae bacterium]|nr:ankyrin repeat domain-containing protein [Leptospiraceae bacterium]MCP5494575.1 ankyrin repeat domain-containing protein [Leptospiraceae bacterium]
MQTDFELIEEAVYPYANDDLRDSIELNYFKGIERALEDGADPNFEDDYSNEGPLLLLAVRKRNIKFTELLLKYKADPNKNGYNSPTPLTVAIENNDIKIAKLLIENGATIHSEELIKAVENNNIEIARLLLKNQQV